MQKKITQLYDQVPQVIKAFLIRAIIVFVVWNLLYHIILLPNRVPDKQFTHLTALQTKFILSFIYNADSLHILPEDRLTVQKETIFYNNKRIVGIADGCNGLELYVLYISFLICFPTSLKRAFVFAGLGSFLIFIANNIRCSLIAILNFNSSSLSDVAHHYVFKLLIYGLMFFLWIQYTKKKSSDL